MCSSQYHYSYTHVKRIIITLRLPTKLLTNICPPQAGSAETHSPVLSIPYVCNKHNTTGYNINIAGTYIITRLISEALVEVKSV